MLLGGPRRVPARCSRQITEENSRKDPEGAQENFFGGEGGKELAEESSQEDPGGCPGESGRDFSGGPWRVPRRKFLAETVG